MLTLHRAALLLPDPAASGGAVLSVLSGPSVASVPSVPSVVSVSDGAVVVQGERIAALGPYAELAAAHPAARVRGWGEALLVPGLRNPYGRWLLEDAYHPDPREGIGSEPVPGGLAAGAEGGGADDVRCGASARRGLQRMLGYGVTAVVGPFDRAAVRTAVARSGLHVLSGGLSGGLPGGPSGDPSEGASGGLPGGLPAVGGSGAAPGAGPLDPLAALPLAEAVHGRLAVGGRADFAVLALRDGAPGACLATVLAGRLVYRRR
ncbi:imidazolonepropionase-like domain-containing protein [Kitasatospora sp. NPDC054939]